MDYKFKTEPYAHQLHALGASHNKENFALFMEMGTCLLYTSPSPRDGLLSRMPSSA